MARITTYTIDGTITDDDKLLGTDAENTDVTRNYLVGDLATFITSDWVAVGSGTTDYIPLWTPDGNTIGDSIMFMRPGGQELQVGVHPDPTIQTTLGAGFMSTGGFGAQTISATNINGLNSGTVTLTGGVIIGDQATDILQITSSVSDSTGTGSTEAGQVLVSNAAGQLVWGTDAGVSGTGTTSTLPLWSDGPNSTLGDSIITQAAFGQGITIAAQLDVTADFYVSGSTQLSGNVTIEDVATFNNGAIFNSDAYFYGIETSIQGALLDGASTPGTAGQILSTTGTAIEWITPGTFEEEIVVRDATGIVGKIFANPGAFNISAEGPVQSIRLKIEGENTLSVLQDKSVIIASIGQTRNKPLLTVNGGVKIGMSYLDPNEQPTDLDAGTLRYREGEFKSFLEIAMKTAHSPDVYSWVVIQQNNY